MTDDLLHQQLRNARPTVPLPSTFQGDVWGRLEAAEWAREQGSASHILQRCLAWLSRPIPAVALVLLTGSVGCLVAAFANKAEPEKQRETVYIRSVSPFAAAKLSHR
jgi:di/tricarboxylate transporter